MKKLLPFVLGKYLNTLSHVAPAKAGHHGFKLFCYPARPALKKYHRDWSKTAEQSTIEFQGEKIQTLKWGDGPKKVLFLHGWQSHSFRWKNYVDKFPKDEYTLIAVDAPGHGLSTGNFLTLPHYSELIEDLLINMKEVHTIVGHSIGAFAALYTLYRLPDAPVQKLVLLAPPGEASEFIEFYKQTLRLTDKTLRQVLNHFEQVITVPITYFSAPAFAKGLKQHGLIIHDEDDPDTSVKHAVAIHKNWGQSELLITKGLGHNLRSEEIINKVFDFVDSVPAQVPMEVED